MMKPENESLCVMKHCGHLSGLETKIITYSAFNISRKLFIFGGWGAGGWGGCTALYIEVNLQTLS